MPTNKIKSNNELTKSESDLLDINELSQPRTKDVKDSANSSPETAPENNIDKSEKSKSVTDTKAEVPKIPKKPVKPPKIEDKPFDEFITNYFIPGLKSSIEETGTPVNDIKLMEGKRPVVGGNCWMVFCELSEQRRFWLCFNQKIITSDKTILLAESNSDPSIVESFLIDEKKTTLALLISRVLQRLNGQKWIGVN